MRISDWSSDVCSSDLPGRQDRRGAGQQIGGAAPAEQAAHAAAAATTADAEAATLAPLQQDDADEGERQENVDDQENCRHDTRCLSRRPCRGAVARLCNGYGAAWPAKSPRKLRLSTRPSAPPRPQPDPKSRGEGTREKARE